MSQESTPGRLGRPRSLAADDAILRATLEVIAEHGIHDASVDEIAARAHAGKDTIYRRWPHKGDLIRAALDHAPDATLPLPDSGSVSDDLIDYLGSLDDLLASAPTGQLLRELVGEAPHDAAVADRLAAFRGRHLTAITTIMLRESGTQDHADTVVAATLLDWLCGRRLIGDPERTIGRGGAIGALVARLLGPAGDPALNVPEIPPRG